MRRIGIRGTVTLVFVLSAGLALQEEMKRLGKRYDVETYEGAGHAFLRQQDGREGANLRAAQKAWSRTVQFLKQALSARTTLAAPTVPVALGGADFACVCEGELSPSEVALISD